MQQNGSDELQMEAPISLTNINLPNEALQPREGARAGEL